MSKTKTVGNFELKEGIMTISCNGIFQEVSAVLIHEIKQQFLDRDCILSKHSLDDFQSEDDIKNAVKAELCEAIYHLKVFDLPWEDATATEEIQNDLLQVGLVYVEDLLDSRPRDIKELTDEKRQALANALAKSYFPLNEEWTSFVGDYQSISISS